MMSLDRIEQVLVVTFVIFSLVAIFAHRRHGQKTALENLVEPEREKPTKKPKKKKTREAKVAVPVPEVPKTNGTHVVEPVVDVPPDVVEFEDENEWRTVRRRKDKKKQNP